MGEVKKPPYGKDRLPRSKDLPGDLPGKGPDGKPELILGKKLKTTTEKQKTEASRKSSRR